ncbi:MAG: DUF882 domain-containing protein [Burkholderiaceae bacterium]|nr:MAG: DUF882 domain-containing protein [Burkholderiaceae bacterium]TBR76725.1 MAG: DUF882 domain-containing protein [Burkholderiaceae bacterium]
MRLQDPFLIDPIASPVDAAHQFTLNRRGALRGLAALGLGATLMLEEPGVALAYQQAAAANALAGAVNQEGFWSRDRTLWAQRTSTGETIRCTYWSKGQIIQSEYERLCWFARDTTLQRLIREDSPHIRGALASGRFTSAQISPWTMMNPIIFDVHYAITSWLSWFNMARPIEWTSAFRHPITNELTEGAVRDSWHIHGGAIDSRIPGVPTEQFGRFAKWLGAGGVGVYITQAFAHTDVGRVRSWRS